MRGDHLVRHLRSHITSLRTSVTSFMTDENRRQAAQSRWPVVHNVTFENQKTNTTFAVCLACGKGATEWTHTLPKDFIPKTYRYGIHYKESPLCFTPEAFDKVKMFFEDEVVPTPGIAPAPPREALTPRVQEALDAALAYEGDDEEEDDDGPKTVDDKVAELLKSYRSIQRMAVKRFEENRKLKDEMDITREMMKLYRKAAVRYRRGERFKGIKRGIAIARADLANVRGAAAESSSGTEDLSSESDRST